MLSDIPRIRIWNRIEKSSQSRIRMHPYDIYIKIEYEYGYPYLRFKRIRIQIFRMFSHVSPSLCGSVFSVRLAAAVVAVTTPRKHTSMSLGSIKSYFCASFSTSSYAGASLPRCLLFQSENTIWVVCAKLNEYL